MWCCVRWMLYHMALNHSRQGFRVLPGQIVTTARMPRVLTCREIARVSQFAKGFHDDWRMAETLRETSMGWDSERWTCDQWTKWAMTPRSRFASDATVLNEFLCHSRPASK